ncbi:MAG: S1 RNA-binding domain-containing protein, partial [Candidatus Binatia bacterium]|nr:S1 RNA-binding domain-containing protein [Candidatus Binatia bacterium]
MSENVDGKKDEVGGGEDDFRTLFEKSIRSVQPGGVVTGKVVDITPTHVVVDVGYKTEGQIPIREFSDRGGTVLVKVG